MKERVITGTLIALGMAAIFAGAFFVPAVMNIVLLLMMMVAVFECFGALGISDRKALYVLSALTVAAFSLTVYLRRYDLLLPLGLLYLLASLVLTVLNHEKYPFSKSGIAFFTTLYVVGGFGSLLLLGMHYTDSVQHWMMMILVIFGSWFGDVGGWTFGKLMGKHKLCPKLSPKKTWEGLLGSVVFCALGFVGLGLLFGSFEAGSSVNVIGLLILAPLFTVFEVFGDLAASALKREFGVKDYGKIFPGHGGIMDRFDGIMVSGLFVYLFSGFVKLL